MSHSALFSDGHHLNIMLEDELRGLGVQANHHLIVHGTQVMLLDPGGRTYLKNLRRIFPLLGDKQIRYIFLSHQDPDVAAGLPEWFSVSDAEALLPEMWVRFVAEYGLDLHDAERLVGVPDQGTVLDLGGCTIKLIPAHFLHSSACLQVYDPMSKILYTGDLGGSFGLRERAVSDFDEHRKYMEPFNKRMMGSPSALRAWANMVEPLDIEMIVPQHGAFFRGKALVAKFIDGCRHLECGADAILDAYKVPD